MAKAMRPMSVDAHVDATVSIEPIKKAKRPHSPGPRPLWVDALVFFLPMVFHGWMTDCRALMLIGCIRVVVMQAMLAAHWVFVDKEAPYVVKVSQRQLNRERNDYLVPVMMHMWGQVLLQCLFPGMFFSPLDKVYPRSALATLVLHIVLVEPIYYAVHRWLHVPSNMVNMHGHHHQSVSTLPATGAVQDFVEHIVYIVNFGPAMFIPFFVFGAQHWTVIGAYLLLFDVINAFGHTNIKLRHWLFSAAWSPLTYLFYTPEFHLGHHAYYTKNYSLFMPIWDHLMGTYRHFEKTPAPSTVFPAGQQDYVFLGHNAGLGHLLTIPEVSVYNMYDRYVRTWLPLKAELFLVHLINQAVRLLSKLGIAPHNYTLPRYLIDDGKLVGRVVVLFRTPLDYIVKSNYKGVNREIIDTIRYEHKRHGTRYWALGNLNKMKQLNDGGKDIVEMIKKDPYLCDKKIRVWTGDTLTAASVYHQVLDLPDVSEIFYVGANGKVGKAVCFMLAKKGIKVKILSSFKAFEHPSISYTDDVKEMAKFRYVLIGKLNYASYYKKVVNPKAPHDQILLDYTVPFFPLPCGPKQKHVQIGLLRVTDETFLKGHYDACMGNEQNTIFPCHAGGIINTVERKEVDEVGEIDMDEMEPMWAKATERGLHNVDLSTLLGASTKDL